MENKIELKPFDKVLVRDFECEIWGGEIFMRLKEGADLTGIKEDSIVKIMGIAQTDYLGSGELLWERPQKQAITKAEIAEKLCMSEQDFEIIK